MSDTIRRLRALGLSPLLPVAHDLRRTLIARRKRDTGASGLPVSEEAIVLLDDGVRLRSEGKPTDAIPLLSRCLEIEPGNAHALHERGLCHYHLADHEAARADFTRAIEASPDPYGSWLMRGFARLFLGDVDGALADGAATLQRNPDIADAHALIALALGARAQRRGWIERSARREDVERALTHVRHAVGCGYARWDTLTQHPYLALVRRLPGFAEILKFRSR